MIREDLPVSIPGHEHQACNASLLNKVGLAVKAESLSAVSRHSFAYTCSYSLPQSARIVSTA